MNKTQQTRKLMESLNEVFSESPDWKLYKSSHGEEIKGYISTWNKGTNGNPVVYGVMKNTVGDINSFIVVAGLLMKENFLDKTTEAVDDWFGNEKDALETAKAMALDQPLIISHERLRGK